MAKEFLHPSNLHLRDRQAGVLQRFGLKGYGLLMVVLESVTRNPNGSMVFDSAKQESLCRMYRVEHQFLMDVVLTAVSLRILSFSDDRLLNKLEKRLDKAVKTIQVIENDDEFRLFAERIMAKKEFQAETMESLSRQRVLFLRYLENNPAKKKKYVNFEAAFENWLESPYRTERPTASGERVVIPR